MQELIVLRAINHCKYQIFSSEHIPGGMLMPERHHGSSEQRYLYNGMEQDLEVSGNGNSYTTEFRQYDPRLMRWKSLDPLMSLQPFHSPYLGFNCNPVYFIDPSGLIGGPANNYSKRITLSGSSTKTGDKKKSFFSGSFGLKGIVSKGSMEYGSLTVSGFLDNGTLSGELSLTTAPINTDKEGIDKEREIYAGAQASFNTRGNFTVSGDDVAIDLTHSSTLLGINAHSQFGIKKRGKKKGKIGLKLITPIGGGNRTRLQIFSEIWHHNKSYSSTISSVSSKHYSVAQSAAVKGVLVPFSKLGVTKSVISGSVDSPMVQDLISSTLAEGNYGIGISEEKSSPILKMVDGEVVMETTVTSTVYIELTGLYINNTTLKNILPGNLSDLSIVGNMFLVIQIVHTTTSQFFIPAHLLNEN